MGPGVQPQRFQSDYWRHMVEATRPGLVVPIHWDDFSVSLDRRLRPLRMIFDRFAVAKAFLDRGSAEGGIPYGSPSPSR